MSARVVDPIRFLSICSGIEAASLAFGPLGWTAAGFAEIAGFPAAVLAARFGSNLPGEALSRNAPPNYGDFTAINPRAVGRVDVLCGGTPCQAFSVAGRRRSLADARGNLTLAFALLAHELVEYAGLRNAVWENVPGILSLEDNAFGCFLGELVGADGPLLPSERPRRGKSSAVWRWREAGRKPILDDDGNETGEFVEWDEGHLPRWPRAGMVAGPLGRAAYRVLDAQHFGVPQRRERIVLVGDFGNGADPAEVLFEPKGLRGDLAKGRGAREGIARPLGAGSPGSGGWRADADTAENLVVEPASGLPLREVRRDERSDLGSDLRMVRPRAFGGNNTAGEINVAAALNAHGGPSGRLDFESETFVVDGVAPPLTRSPYGDNSSREKLLIVQDVADTLTAHWERSKGAKGGNAAGLINPIIEAPICFDTTQITHPENRCNPQPGGPSHPLSASAHPPAVAFQDRFRGDDGRGYSRPPPVFEDSTGALETVKPWAVAYDLRGREDGAQFEGPHDTANLRAASGGSSRSYVAEHWAVRRLLPVECERLQGMPDGWTAIETRGALADGPRYAAIGNSWARPVFAWLGARLDAALRARGEPEGSRSGGRA
jgi:DNA (cytosine-5)-methyltransferase 1